MITPKIIVTRRWPEEVETELACDFDVELNTSDRPFSADELKQAFADADAVLPTVTDPITADVLGGEPRARLLANFGVGFNHIDLDAARHHGITVTNTPGVLTDCTADLTMTLLLMVARRAGEGERQLRSQQWSGWRPTHLRGRRVTGKTLGLVGMGRIATAVAKRAHHGFGMRIVFHNPSPPPAEVVQALDATPYETLEEVLAQSDFVSLHCPGGAATRHLIDARRLAAMRPHAFLINTARGDVIDTQALIAALRTGAIAGAGLDVYEGEPHVDPVLTRLENVVLLPHLGSASIETRLAMGRRVLENLRAFFDGRIPRDKVV